MDVSGREELIPKSKGREEGGGGELQQAGRRGRQVCVCLSVCAHAARIEKESSEC